jgi:hypothetical protein
MQQWGVGVDHEEMWAAGSNKQRAAGGVGGGRLARSGTPEAIMSARCSTRAPGQPSPTNDDQHRIQPPTMQPSSASATLARLPQALSDYECPSRMPE